MELNISTLSAQTQSALIRFASARWRCEQLNSRDVYECIHQAKFVDTLAEKDYFQFRRELIDSLRNDGLNNVADKLDWDACEKAYRAAWRSDDKIITLEDGDTIAPEDTRAAEISHRFWEQMKADEYEIYQLGLQLRDQN